MITFQKGNFENDLGVKVLAVVKVRSQTETENLLIVHSFPIAKS